MESSVICFGCCWLKMYITHSLGSLADMFLVIIGVPARYKLKYILNNNKKYQNVLLLYISFLITVIRINFINNLNSYIDTVTYQTVKNICTLTYYTINNKKI